MRKFVMLAAAAGLFATMSHHAFAEESCTGSGTPLAKSAVEAQLKAKGYTQIKEMKSHGGCYEAKGLDKNGQRFELEVNSYTGEINQAE